MSLFINNDCSSEEQTMANRQKELDSPLALVFELFEAGETMMRMKFKRLHPQENDANIDARVQAWLYNKPMADVSSYGVIRERT